MWELLDGVVAGNGNDSARRKTITVLMKAWAMPGSPSTPLRMKAAQLLQNATRAERLALHWAMLIASYPLFSDVADSIGRISDFHDQFGSAQVTKRMIGLWGDRSTLVRATQRLISSMAQWGVLTHLEGARAYAPPAHPRSARSTGCSWSTHSSSTAHRGASNSRPSHRFPRCSRSASASWLTRLHGIRTSTSTTRDLATTLSNSAIRGRRPLVVSAGVLVVGSP